MTDAEQAIEDIRRLAEPNANLGVPWAVIVMTFIEAIDVKPINPLGCDVCGATPTTARPNGFKFCAAHGGVA